VNIVKRHLFADKRGLFFCRTELIRISPRGDIQQEIIGIGKGEIFGISRFFPGMGVYIRRVEGLAGGDG
jgi:hypothetical protein